MGKKILLVEDNEDSRVLACKVLTRHGMEVIEATGGEEALRLAALHLPDLILMDLGLGGMSGDQAAMELRAEGTTSGIPVVAFSAYSREEKGGGLAGGLYDGFIEKPIDVRTFATLVTGFMKEG